MLYMCVVNGLLTVPNGGKNSVRYQKEISQIAVEAVLSITGINGMLDKAGAWLAGLEQGSQCSGHSHTEIRHWYVISKLGPASGKYEESRLSDYGQADLLLPSYFYLSISDRFIFSGIFLLLSMLLFLFHISHSLDTCIIYISHSVTIDNDNIQNHFQPILF